MAEDNRIHCLGMCGRVRCCRGLCMSCWGKASRLVRSSLATWAELEAAGKSLPPAVRGFSGFNKHERRRKAT